MKFWAVRGTMVLLGTALSIATSHSALAAAHKTTKAAVISHTPKSADAKTTPRATHIAETHASHEHGFTGRSHLLHTAMATGPISHHSLLKNGKEHIASRGGYSGISCVPFARAASGIELKGNAANWWDAASGVYARGSVPEPGSVLNFRATGHMRLGHVAVVTEVVNSRQVEIDHANWGGSRGGIARGIPVIDVSENNDWSEVRVAMGHGADFGSVYPTYGFIYDRPDSGSMMASAKAPVSRNAAFDEVAEAPPAATTANYIDAPSHSVR
jgi:surface antigen